MLVLISYDVEVTSPGGARRLRRIAKACKDYGQRVQFSVFECELAPDQWVLLRARLVAEMDAERDSLRFYFLGASGRRRVEHVGAKPAVDLEGPLIL
ncbi:CRISPR-associated endonuclease Cas2 [Acidisoma cellulosilytica]|uniref:CRISPR-associated endoribonuclease Cas2 n=1 Tax=Acidisoma cellulosilyticum TaxID=2802395 RepID=A0A964E294_9PROT|nr:CRISPR-associated endonuclease Cas2 [Acidisoma cellulosilyticum]MCB8879375.1 CRISPR-associated endonuclease Cas2 [Acidisoma cellulosilyticum]